MEQITLTPEQEEKLTNGLGKAFAESFPGCSLLDKNNISWKIHNGEWIGKRSVWTFDNRACWLEDTTPENVSAWWCEKESDYTEIFTR